MKRFLNIAVFIAGVIFSIAANAQSGLNNNSNWKTPIPNIIVPQSPTGAGTNVTTSGPVIQNTIQLPVLPALPPLTLVTPPISVPNITVTALLPAMPVTPTAPAAPTANFISSMPAAVPLVTLPLLPTLPPVPPIAPVPELRLVLKP